MAFYSLTLHRYESGRRLNGVIFLHRISDVRMGGVARKNFRLFRKLCGDESLSSVAIVTNMWNEVTQQKGEQRERELANNGAFFKSALEKGACMIRHDDTAESAHNIVSRLADRDTITLAVQREMVKEHKMVSQTSAGLDLQAELNEQSKRHRAGLRDMQARMEALMREKDDQHQEELKELNEAIHDVREQMMKVKSHSAKLQDDRIADKKKFEQEAQEMTKAMQEREDRLRDLHEFAMSQKEMLMELKENLADVQRKAEAHDTEKQGAEDKLKVAQDTHKAELEVLRNEFEEKLAAALGSASKKPTEGPPPTPTGPLPRTKSQTGPRKAPPGFFSGLALVLDQLFVAQIAV